MPSIRHYRAFIMVDGQKLPEYKVEKQDDGNTVRCWIPSETGKEFAIHWVDLAQASETAGYVYIDGEHIGGRFTRPDDSSGHVYLENRPLSSNSTAALKFGKMELTDEESDVESEEIVKNMGTIKVIIKEGIIGEAYEHSYKAVSQKPVNERSKKAGGHRVVLGEQKSSPQTWKQFYPFKTESVTFIFQYRPLEVLRAMDIIPAAEPAESEACRERPIAPLPTRAAKGKAKQAVRSPPRGSSSEVEDHIKEEEDDAAENRAPSPPVRELRKRFLDSIDNASPKRAAKRKSEVIDLTQSDDESDTAASGSSGSSSESRPTKKVKTEPEERMLVPLKPSSKTFKKGEVIDLT